MKFIETKNGLIPVKSITRIHKFEEGAATIEYFDGEETHVTTARVFVVGAGHTDGALQVPGITLELVAPEDLE
jgi:hypothetical protein